MLVLLGSHALQHYIKLVHTPRDIDILGEYDEVVVYMKKLGKPVSIYPISEGKKLIAKYDDSSKTIVEAEIDWGHGSSHSLHRLAVENGNSSSEGIIVPNLDLLLTIKESHKYLRNSPHFHKTMTDIHLMRAMGAKIRPNYMDFLKEREKETYSYKHPSLNQTKNNFFNGDGIKYEFDHDSIHEAVKHLSKPAYAYYSNGEVTCDMNVFEKLDERTKLYGVLEEVYVLALERSQIPLKNASLDPKKSFLMALEKVCTSITSGRFREFAWENYAKVLNLYDPNYVTRFWSKVSLGEVKPYLPLD